MIRTPSTLPTKKLKKKESSILLELGTDLTLILFLNMDWETWAKRASEHHVPISPTSMGFGAIKSFL